MPKIKIVPFPGSLGLRGLVGEPGQAGADGSVNSPYTPSESSSWQSPQPETIASALDQIAARLSVIEQS
jgi:hypothetical protein